MYQHVREIVSDGEKAPEKHYGKGMPLLELFRMFPDNETEQE